MNPDHLTNVIYHISPRLDTTSYVRGAAAGTCRPCINILLYGASGALRPPNIGDPVLTSWYGDTMRA